MADDRRTCMMAVAGLLEPFDYMHLVKPPRKYRPKRRASLARAIRTAREAGIDKGTVTVGDVTVTFGSEPEPQQCTELDKWIAKHAH